MYRLHVIALTLATALCALVSAQSPGSNASLPRVLTLNTSEPSELRDWDRRLTRMQESGELTLRSVRADTLLAGRNHERYDHYVQGVRVFGGQIVRQVFGGSTASIFGTLYDSASLNTTPRLSEREARGIFFSMAPNGEFLDDTPVELLLLPTDDNRLALAWRAHVWTDSGWMDTFLDAHNGQITRKGVVSPIPRKRSGHLHPGSSISRARQPKVCCCDRVADREARAIRSAQRPQLHKLDATLLFQRRWNEEEARLQKSMREQPYGAALSNLGWLRFRVQRD